MYVFDRAYNDFDFWKKIIATGSDFVTRLKDCARNRVLQKKVLRGRKHKCGVLYDGPYVSTSPSAKKSKIKLRHIIYRDKLTKKIFHFVTSDRNLSAKAIADIYKRRWAVELLFRWLKGHLDVRYLPTKTPNAVKTQLAVAVLVQLLLQLKRLIEKYQGTLWELLRDIRTSFVQKILAGCGPPEDSRDGGRTYVMKGVKISRSAVKPIVRFLLKKTDAVTGLSLKHQESRVVLSLHDST
ncbi:MAG: transposase [Calothrix sp. SM1_5_4]|nr:transposase [Calothrix sp. SM1_5_4]